jgi:hypothetical protein
MFIELVEEVQQLDDGALDARLRRLEVDTRRLEAERAAMLAERERRSSGRADGFRSTVAWARGVLFWSNAECRARMQLVRLIEAFPEVGEALLDGSIPVANADAIARGWANPRVRERFGEFIGEFLNQAERREHDDFKLFVERYVMLADVDGAHRDREQIHENRKADFVEFQGQGTLVAQWGDADTAINQPIFETFVQAEWDADWAWTVEQYGDDATVAQMPRTNAQRRADALSAIMRRAAGAPKGASGAGPKVVANVHIDWQNFQDLLAWAGLFPDRVRDPFAQADTLVQQWRCDTTDGQLIDPIAVLRSALEGYVRFVVLDDHGVPIRWGRERRLFQGAARDAVMTLSTRCTHPGCRVPTSRTEADHLTPWAEGGTTDPSNGAPRCRTHNRLRNQGLAAGRDRWGWHTYRPDGTEIC